MPYKNMGTMPAGSIVTSTGRGGAGRIIKVKDASSASGLAFLKGELEKVDPKLRQPLTAVTWSRDVPVKTGGGWVETLSAMGIDYGAMGGAMEDSIISNDANQIPVIQYDLNRETYKTHIFSMVMRIFWVDLQRSKITDRNLEQMATDGIRLAYDKHMDRNTYLGFKKYDCYGLVNNPDVTVRDVAAGITSSKKKWAEKTPDEILNDINTAILTGWEQAGWDRSAIPNTILIPYKQLAYIANTRIGELAEKTILSFLKENNVAKANGVDLSIEATAYCAGAAANGSDDRMVAYVNDDYFLAMEELVGLTRAMTEPKTDTLSYDTVYTANVSELEIFYNQPITYWDGI